MGNCNGKNAAKSSDTAVEPGRPSELTHMKKEELKKVLDADSVKREDGDPWYVVEAAWVQKWLAFVQGDDSAKRPGPIRNESLLFYNNDAKAWAPKPLLRAARREHMGHYRRVNHHVWTLWTGRYKGGPAVWVDTAPFEDTSNWHLESEFDRSKARGGGTAVAGGREKSHPTRQGTTESGVEGAAHPDRIWPSSTPNLGIGEMEDAGVGDETTAKAAAFFDVAPESPQNSHGSSAAREGTAVKASSGSGISEGTAGTGAGRKKGDMTLELVSTPMSNGGGNQGTEANETPYRSSSALEQWMYGAGVGDGPME